MAAGLTPGTVCPALRSAGSPPRLSRGNSDERLEGGRREGCFAPTFCVPGGDCPRLQPLRPPGPVRLHFLMPLLLPSVPLASEVAMASRPCSSRRPHYLLCLAAPPPPAQPIPSGLVSLEGLALSRWRKGSSCTSSLTGRIRRSSNKDLNRGYDCGGDGTRNSREGVRARRNRG